MGKSNKQGGVNDFSLMSGGLLYRCYVKLGLVKESLSLLKRRTLFVCLFAWLPLLILSIYSGVAFSHVKVPFIYDIDAHVRFLVSLALLIYAEVIAHERLQVIVQQFLKRRIITTENKPKFNAMMASAIQHANSLIVEIFLIIFVVTVGFWVSEKYFPFGVSAWYTHDVNGAMQFTLPGYWYAFVSLPLFQFIVLRWYYRIAIWYRFLWQVSRLPLKLNSLHPDRAGGIGFLSNSVYAFAPLLLAHSVLLTGMILNRIWNAGATVSQFQGEIGSILVFLIILPLAPMMFFMFALVRTKRGGTLAYGAVATRYVNRFREKWISTTSDNGEILGTSDIQSLADLANSFEVSAQMRILPFGKGSIISIVILTAFPLLPLLFIVMPLERIISKAIGVIF